MFGRVFGCDGECACVRVCERKRGHRVKNTPNESKERKKKGRGERERDHRVKISELYPELSQL